MHFRGILAAATLALSVTVAAAAVPPETQPALTAEQQALVEKYNAIARQLHPLTGDIKIPQASVTLHLGKRYYFLKADEAKLVLRDAWGNSDDQIQGVLGLIFPADKTFVDDTWGAVVTYQDSGYVPDDDAASTDYDAVIKSVQDGEDEFNAKRKERGLYTMHLVGWAQPPGYDKTRHTLIWAQDLRIGGATEDTLNYDIRILGRRGLLSMNMITAMRNLAPTRTAANELQRVADFDAGARYSDYNAGTDKKAEYGVAGLVAAGVGGVIAQKLGLFGILLLFFKKAAVFLVAGFGAVVAWFRRFFGGRKDQA
jgi:uncharacterized membrane-anchored protein